LELASNPLKLLAEESLTIRCNVTEAKLAQQEKEETADDVDS